MTNQELLALVKKNPISVGCGALALLCGLGIYFRSDGLPAAETLLDQKLAEGERLALNLKNSAQLKEQQAVVMASTREVEARLVRAGELAKNLQYFYKLEAATGVKLIDLRQIPAEKPKSGTKSTNFSGISYAVTVDGEYVSLIEFLRQMESGAHYSRVIAANMSGTKVERGGSLRLTLTVELLGLP